MRWRLVLLWLCIALLPLRGWAFGLPPVMPVQGASHASAGHAPCHGVPAAAGTGGHVQGHGHLHAMPHGHADALPSDAAPATPELPAPGTCALCDVCHGGAFALPVFLDGFAPLSPGAPPAWTPRPAGRLAVNELFRPPRA